MIDWNRFTDWTERYGHLWAGVVALLAAAVVASTLAGIIYTITLIAR